LEWNALRLRLENQIEDIAAKIQSYPPPITGCDEQFNHFLELRRVLPQELARLDNVVRDRSLTIHEFIVTSPIEEILSDLSS